MVRTQNPSLEVPEGHMDAVQTARGNNTMAVAVLRKNVAGQAVGKARDPGSTLCLANATMVSPLASGTNAHPEPS